MLKLVGWLAVIATLAFLIWQIAVAEPLWPRAVTGLLLAIIGLLAGIRIGTDSVTAYTQDLQRVNKLLADQNQDLQDTNAMLLREVRSESDTLPKPVTDVADT